MTVEPPIVAFENRVRLWHDEDNPDSGLLRLGGGLIPPSEAERRAAEAEAEGLRQAALERQRTHELLARVRGQEGDGRHTVGEMLARHAAAARADNRQPLVLDASVAGAKPRPVRADDPLPDEDDSPLVDPIAKARADRRKRIDAQAEEGLAAEAKPATVGDVSKLKQALANVSDKVSSLWIDRHP